MNFALNLAMNCIFMPINFKTFASHYWVIPIKSVRIVIAILSNTLKNTPPGRIDVRFNKFL